MSNVLDIMPRMLYTKSCDSDVDLHVALAVYPSRVSLGAVRGAHTICGRNAGEDRDTAGSSMVNAVTGGARNVLRCNAVP